MTSPLNPHPLLMAQRILSYYGFPYSDEETKQGGPISPSEAIELVRRYEGQIKERLEW